MIQIGETNYGSLRRGDKRTISLRKGTYSLIAISTPGAYLYQAELIIKDSTLSVEVDLSKTINAERRKSDSIARERDKNSVSAGPPVKKANPEGNVKPKVITPAVSAVDTLLSNMVPIAAGSFSMGNNLGDNDEGPEHTVNIHAFKCSKYEVTQQQWEAVMGSNPSVNKGCATCPVENVSIADIDAFIKSINKISAKTFRLPSEAEWEYVAKKGGVFKDVTERAWYNSNSGKLTQPVGTKWPNGLGIFDMSGNVAEWCSDWYNSSYYKKKTADNPAGPESGDKKTVRGGAFNDSENTLRPSHRDKQTADTRKQTIGFRLVMDAG